MFQPLLLLSLCCYISFNALSFLMSLLQNSSAGCINETHRRHLKERSDYKIMLEATFTSTGTNKHKWSYVIRIYWHMHGRNSPHCEHSTEPSSLPPAKICRKPVYASHFQISKTNRCFTRQKVSIYMKMVTSQVCCLKINWKGHNDILCKRGRLYNPTF